MKIYRFTPRIAGYAHPWRSVAGRWWPDGIELGPAMDQTHDMSSYGIRPHADRRYDRSPEVFNQQHQALYEAVRDHDPSRARAAMTAHLDYARELLDRFSATKGDDEEI